MFRATDLIDLPIKTLNQEKSLKLTVKSILLDGLQNRIAAFVCKEGAMRKSCQILEYNHIISIDMNGVVIADGNCVKKIHSKELNNYLQIESVIKKLVRTRTGDLYGIVTDLYINLLSGKIVAYEMSEGYIDDLVKGRKLVNIEQVTENTLMNKEIIVESR